MRPCFGDKIVRIGSSVLCAIIAVSCASGQFAPLPKVMTARPTEVVVMRPRKTVGGMISIQMTVDRHKVVALASGDCIKIRLDPGPHLVGARCYKWPMGWYEDAVQIDAEPGGRHWVSVALTMMSNAPEVVALDEQAASRNLADCHWLDATQ